MEIPYLSIHMRFEKPLLSGYLIRRYKRFLADIRMEDGRVVTVHCPNSGSMKSCLGEDWPVRLSRSDNPRRKLPLTWEMVHNGRCWIGINTLTANRLAYEAIQNGTITELQGYNEIQKEVRYGRQNSRIDLMLRRNDGSTCYVEVKNVTLVGDDGSYQFPDAVTLRGQKHLNELMHMVEKGNRAVMLFIIQRTDGIYFRPAQAIDPDYSRLLLTARAAGVEILPYVAEVSPQQIIVSHRVKFLPEPS